MGNIIGFLYHSLVNGLIFVAESLFSTNAFFILTTLVIIFFIYKAEKEEIDEMLVEDDRDIV